MNIFKRFYIANLILWVMIEKKPLTIILIFLFYPIVLGFVLESIELAEALGLVDEVKVAGELNGATKG